MKADYPYKNPSYRTPFPDSKQIPVAKAQTQSGNQVSMTYQQKGNKLVKAYLMYTTNGGNKSEEWFRMDAEIKDNQVSAKLPKGTTHYIFNLIDDKNFLVSYPSMGQVSHYKKKGIYSTKALKAN